MRLGTPEPGHVDVAPRDAADDLRTGDEDPRVLGHDHDVGERGPVRRRLPRRDRRTTEICGITPDTLVIAANIRPTPCIDSTPSARRARPGATADHRAAEPVRPRRWPRRCAPRRLPERAAHPGRVGAVRDDHRAVHPPAHGLDPAVVVGVQRTAEPGSSSRASRTEGAR